MHFTPYNYINKEICLMLNIYSSLPVIILLMLNTFKLKKMQFQMSLT